jgi:hypothetical protein
MQNAWLMTVDAALPEAGASTIDPAFRTPSI